MATLQKSINYSLASEQDFRGYIKEISSGLLSLGLVRVTSTIDTLTFASASSQAADVSSSYDYQSGTYINSQNFSVYNCFDASVADSNSGGSKTLATRWRSNALPSISSPETITYDAITSLTVSTYKVLLSGSDADIKTWTLETSSDNNTWTIIDTQTGITGAGYKTYTLTSPATSRYFKLKITANNGNTSYCELIDWDLRNASNTRLPTPASILPTANNQYPYSEIWRFNDPFQTLNPVFFQLYFGKGYNGLPAITLWVGSEQTFARRREFVVQHNEGARNTFFSGNNGKLCFGINTDNTLLISLERTKTQEGVSTAEGLAMMCGGYYSVPYVGWQATTQCCVYDNLVPRALTETYSFFPTFMCPNRSNGVDGTTVHLYPVFPFNIKMLPPMDSLFFYFDADITKGTVFNQTVYGNQRTYMALGSLNLASTNNSSGSSYGYGTPAIAIIWE